VHAGAAQAADKLGDTEIIWKGSQLESDREGQIAVVRTSCEFTSADFGCADAHHRNPGRVTC